MVQRKRGHDDAVLGAPADRVMDRDDMRMLRFAGKPGFGQERALRLLPFHLARERITGYLPMLRGIASLMNFLPDPPDGEAIG